MSRFLLAVALVPALLATACKPKSSDAPPPAATDEVAPVPAEPEPAPEPEPAATPQSLYEACIDRVELPQADGECTKDEDCATAGCGNEVCTSTKEQANVMTTCEDRLCFKVLEACGCHEGHCSWTLKAEVPAEQVPAPGGSLPPSLPSTIEKGDGDVGGDKAKGKAQAAPEGDEATEEPAPAPK
ncbi:MAG: hypothetical protein R3F59_29710 [Myxococcota bacterium]